VVLASGRTMRHLMGIYIIYTYAKKHTDSDISGYVCAHVLFFVLFFCFPGCHTY